MDSGLLSEDLIVNLILVLSYNDIMALCNSSKLCNSICEKEHIWNKLLNRDYPELNDKILEKIYQGKSSKERYKNTHDHVYKTAMYLMNKYQFIKSKYLNKEIMYNDIVEQLKILIELSIEYMTISKNKTDLGVIDMDLI